MNIVLLFHKINILYSNGRMVSNIKFWSTTLHSIKVRTFERIN